jgi:NlpC/P60 family putative phage cell wall peptidase
MALEREAIVAAARGWIGTPYHHQASLKRVGCDCLGVVRGVWREVVGAEPEPLPPYSADWAEADTRERLLAAGERYFVRIAVHEAQPGDVLLFRWRAGAAAKHVAILSAPDRIVHAYDTARAVVEVTLAAGWRRRLVAAFRFPGVSD